MPALFGTDGIRGSFGKYPITEQFFTQCAHLIEQFFKKILKKSVLKIAIGRDTRESGKVLQDALIHGLSDDTCVLDCGIFPTPGVSVVVDHQKCDLGFAITASHNPYTDNGLKIFNSRGEKLSADLELQLEQFLASNPPIMQDMSSDRHVHDVTDFQAQAHQIFIDRFDDIKFRFELPVVLDTANGATTYTSPDILQKYCKNLYIVSNHPDGRNINFNCGSEHIERLQTEVKNRHAHIGIAHDGDGDRLIMVDENARCLNGDQIIGIIANYLKQKQLLTNNVVVVTKQSNCGLDESLKKIGIHTVRTDVGDRNVYYNMVQCGSVLGGEESGHIILRKQAHTGDAISAAVLVLKIISETGSSLSKLANTIRLFPKKMVNLSVGTKIPIEEFTDLTRLLQNFENSNYGYKRSLIRYSGTENKLRILVEADTVTNADNLSNQIRDCLIKEFEKRKIFVK